jgi:hypothetical protein
LEEADMMPELLTRLEEKTTQEALTLFEAFAISCREDLEVEPEKLIEALFGHVMSWIENLETRRKKFDTDADKGLASEYVAAFFET